MNAVKFEQLLSYEPKGDFNINQPCLRDLIFDHFEDDDDLTKYYIQLLWQKFGDKR